MSNDMRLMHASFSGYRTILTVKAEMINYENAQEDDVVLVIDNRNSLSDGGHIRYTVHANTIHENN